MLGEASDTSKRFWRQVDMGSDCWEWKRWHINDHVTFSVDGKAVGAHRFAYEDAIGPIPDGLTIDHLCSNASCMKPSHLEAVSHSENVRRGHARIKAGTVKPFYQRITIT